MGKGKAIEKSSPLAIKGVPCDPGGDGASTLASGDLSGSGERAPARFEFPNSMLQEALAIIARAANNGASSEFVQTPGLSNFDSPSELKNSPIDQENDSVMADALSPSSRSAVLPAMGSSHSRTDAPISSSDFLTGSPKSWAEVLGSKVRKMDASTQLKYYAPQVFDSMPMAVFNDSLIEYGAKLWENTLVLHVVGMRPAYHRLVSYANRVWKPTSGFEIYSRENGFYLVKFESNEDCSRVLDQGPWFFERRLIIMKRWSPDIQYEREVLEVVPTWIRLPGLPIQYWSNEGIARVASIVGCPLYMDEFTAKRKRLAFARVFVEISAKVPLRKEAYIRLPSGVIFRQPIIYEWVPPLCDQCHCFGLLAKACPSSSASTPDCAPVQDFRVPDSVHPMVSPVISVNLSSLAGMQAPDTSQERVVQSHAVDSALALVPSSGGPRPLPSRTPKVRLHTELGDVSPMIHDDWVLKVSKRKRTHNSNKSVSGDGNRSPPGSKMRPR